ncbi:MAG: hypothetical protein RLY14_965 [Planctomycetota bacterium]|jgi:hypothetical protein
MIRFSHAMRLRLLRLHLGVLASILPDTSRRISLQRLLRLFTPNRPSRLYSGITEDQLMAVLKHRLARPWRMRGRRCLREGLLCFYFLRLLGVPAELHFGVFEEARHHEFAHCWVVVEGRCVTKPPEQHYVTIHVARVPSSIAE